MVIVCVWEEKGVYPGVGDGDSVCMGGEGGVSRGGGW